MNEAPRLGIDVPDVVQIGIPFAVRIVGMDDPRSVKIRIVDTDTDREVSAPAFQRDASGLVAIVAVARPGLYRLNAHGSGTPVFCLFMAVETKSDE